MKKGTFNATQGRMIMVEYKQVSISLTPAAEQIFEEIRGPLPFSTFLQLFAYLWKKNLWGETSEFQYLNNLIKYKMKRKPALKAMLEFFEEYEIE